MGPFRISFYSKHNTHTYKTQDTSWRYLAYYIAFGAHGPRALPPPGEGWKVAGYTALGIGISLALFSTIRLFAKGSPSTMNKEYQEATNEYLRVCHLFLSMPLIYGYLLHWFGLGGYSSIVQVIHKKKRKLTIPKKYRPKTPNPSPVSRPKATKDQDKSRAHLRKPNSQTQKIRMPISFFFSFVYINWLERREKGREGGICAYGKQRGREGE